MFKEAQYIEHDSVDTGFFQDELIKTYFPMICSSVKSLSRKYRSSLYDSQDFIQETCIRLLCDNYKILKQYDANRNNNPSGYIRMIAEREIRNLIRKEGAKKRGRHLTIAISDNERDIPCVTGFDTELEELDFSDKLYEWLCNRLSELGIAVLNATYRLGDEASDTAMRLGISTHAVYCWLYKIRVLSREFIFSETGRKV